MIVRQINITFDERDMSMQEVQGICHWLDHIDLAETIENDIRESAIQNKSRFGVTYLHVEEH